MGITDNKGLSHALREPPGWERRGDGIGKTFHFDGFGSAMRFVSRVAAAAQAPGRQPAIDIRGDRVTVAFVREGGSGLTLDDVAVAGRIEQLVGDHRHPVGRAGPWSPGERLIGGRPRPVGLAGP
jgi:4a-hydroxytetrahydrobiopterin dehydratase